MLLIAQLLMSEMVDMAKPMILRVVAAKAGKPAGAEQATTSSAALTDCIDGMVDDASLERHGRTGSDLQ